MSLLLDALHRASKDKEKAAGGVAIPVPAVAPIELRLSDVSPGEASFPQLVHEPEIESNAEATQKPALSSTPTLELETPMPEPVVTPAPALSSPSKLSAAPAWEMAMVSEPVQSQTEKSLEPVSPQLTSGPQAAPNPILPEGGADRAAKEIRRAYASAAAPSNTGKRRLFILGGVAVALLISMGSVFLGLWGDPVALLGLGGTSSIAPAVPSPTVQLQGSEVSVRAADATPSPASSPAHAPAVEVNAPAKDLGAKAAPKPQGAVSSPAVAVQASTAVTAPLSLAGNEVVLRGSAPKPGFVAKTQGPSPLEMGYSALLAGRLDEAAHSYRQALKANSEERDALLGLAYIAHKKGLREDAQSYYRRVLRQEPNNAIANAALLALGSEADASQSSRRARDLVARQPDSAATMAIAGTAMARDGMLSDAAQLFARAQALEPGNPLHAYNHAVALDRLGQYGLALVQYEKVLKLSETAQSPSGTDVSTVDAVRHRLGQLRQALGSQEEARK